MRTPVRPAMNRWTLPAAAVGVAILAACSREPPPGNADPTQRGPRDTLARLIELRHARHYDAMAELIVAPRRHEVTRALLAVDEFMAANVRLCVWIRDHVGVGLAQTIDQGYIADDLGPYLGESLGVFSREVELLDEIIDQRQATVAFVVGRTLPARDARLQRVRTRWRFDPEPLDADRLAAAFRDLARGLDEVVAELESGRLATAELQADPTRLINKVKARLRRGVNMLSRAQPGGRDAP